jgi:hypothetical protein
MACTHMEGRIQWFPPHWGAFDVCANSFVALFKFLGFLAAAGVHSVILPTHLRLVSISSFLTSGLRLAVLTFNQGFGQASSEKKRF